MECLDSNAALREGQIVKRPGLLCVFDEIGIDSVAHDAHDQLRGFVRADQVEYLPQRVLIRPKFFG